jgi:serine/threonine-protein kinase
VQAIGDVRLALEGAFETDIPQVVAPVEVSQRGHLASTTAGVLLTAVVAGAAGWWFGRPAGPVAQRVSRVQLVVSGTATLDVTGTLRDLAMTPDGARVVYVGNRGTQLFVRALDTLEPVAVYTGVPRGPFVSPDGQWVGFVDAADSTGADAQFVTRLKKVAVTGGPAMTLATLPYQPRGATWAPGEAIIFATSDPETGLQRVATTGGTPTVLTRPDRAHGEADHLLPEQLPGGRAVLFTITALTGGLDAAQVAVLDLQTGKHTVLLRGGSHAHYVPSGHLVYATQGTLRAVLFDLPTLTTRGTPTLVIPDVVTTATGSLDAVATADGTLAYVSGGAAVSSGQAPRTLVWVDRQGRETPLSTPPRAYVQPRLSPDGTRVAVAARDQETDIWLWDLMRATLTRLTFDPGADTTPAWTPDSRRIVFSSSRGTGQNIYIQAADGTGSATRLTDSPNTLNVTGITADGMGVVFHEVTPNRQRDLGLLTLAPPHVESLVETPFEERGGIVSPDGRWLAFESNNSGRFEIYVRPFPNVADGQWQVSNAGGVQPLWSPSGRELFFVATDGALMTVAIESRGTTWSAGAAKTLLGERYYTGDTSYVSRHYDVSPDGQQFLMIKESGTGQTAAPQLIVVQHFADELKRLVPTN